MNRLSIWDNNINYAHPSWVVEQRGWVSYFYLWTANSFSIFETLACVYPSVLPSSQWWRYAFFEHHLDALAARVRFARQTDFLQLMELVSVSFSIAGRENRTSRRLPWLHPHQTGSGGFPGRPKKEEANRLGVSCLLFFFLLLFVPGADTLQFH